MMNLTTGKHVSNVENLLHGKWTLRQNMYRI